MEEWKAKQQADLNIIYSANRNHIHISYFIFFMWYRVPYIKFTLEWMNTCSPWNGVVKLQGVWFIFGAQKEEMEAKFFFVRKYPFFLTDPSSIFI